MKPKSLNYRKYKQFSYEICKGDLVSKLVKEKFNINTLKKVLGICLNIFN